MGLPDHKERAPSKASELLIDSIGYGVGEMFSKLLTVRLIPINIGAVILLALLHVGAGVVMNTEKQATTGFDGTVDPRPEKGIDDKFGPGERLLTEARALFFYLALAAQQWPQVGAIDEMWRGRVG